MSSCCRGSCIADAYGVSVENFVEFVGRQEIWCIAVFAGVSACMLVHEVIGPWYFWCMFVHGLSVHVSE